MKGDALVLFGITGDLAHKKLYGALAGLEAAGALDVPVIGVASSDWDDEKLRAELVATLGAAPGGPTKPRARARRARLAPPRSAAGAMIVDQAAGCIESAALSAHADNLAAVRSSYEAFGRGDLDGARP